MMYASCVTSAGPVDRAGWEMSGDAVAAPEPAGYSTPALCVIANVGVLVRVTVVCCVITDCCTPLKLTSAVFVNASTRTRPKPPTPSQPVPPAAPRASIAPLPVIVVATSRTAPPLPPPPPSGPPFGAPPTPPFARIDPVSVMVPDAALTIAPPPPPPPPPAGPTPVTPAPPPPRQTHNV